MYLMTFFFTAANFGHQVSRPLPDVGRRCDGPNRQPCPGLHQQLCKPHSIRLPKRQLPQSIPQGYLLQTSSRPSPSPGGTPDENNPSSEYGGYTIGKWWTESSRSSYQFNILRAVSATLLQPAMKSHDRNMSTCFLSKTTEVTSFWQGSKPAPDPGDTASLALD